MEAPGSHSPWDGKELDITENECKMFQREGHSLLTSRDASEDHQGQIPISNLSSNHCYYYMYQ